MCMKYREMISESTDEGRICLDGRIQKLCTFGFTFMCFLTGSNLSENARIVGYARTAGEKGRR